jgi:hypothetical protein
VSEATPAGCDRVCRWLGDVAELVEALARVHVVFNRSPRREEAAVGLEAVLARCAAVGGVTTLPYDPKVARACWAGEAVAPSRFTRAVAALAEAALPRSRPAPSRRRRLARVVGR